MATHHYRARCHWRGDTGLGYEHYERAHSAMAPPATQELTVTTGEALGDPSQLNPEQLTRLLHDVLGQNRNLRVLALRVLPATALGQPPPPSGQQPNAPKPSAGSCRRQTYRHCRRCCSTNCRRLPPGSA